MTYEKTNKNEPDSAVKSGSPQIKSPLPKRIKKTNSQN